MGSTFGRATESRVLPMTVEPSAILMGIKHSGKTSLARRLAWAWRARFVDLDDLIEQVYRKDRAVSYREIYRQHGIAYFRELEAQAAERLASTAKAEQVSACLGGGTIENRVAMQTLKSSGLLVYLADAAEQLYGRIMQGELPASLSADHPREDFLALFDRRAPLYEQAADLIVSVKGLDVHQAFDALLSALGNHAHAG